jgi:peroxiredoxin
MGTARLNVAAMVITIALVGCSKNEVSPPAAGKQPLPAEGPATATVAQPTPSPTVAVVGQPAPDLELPSLDGPKVKLSSYRGKVVVLEFFNPDCPFVRQAHSREGQLKGMAAKLAADGVVWLAVNSGGPGRQGHGLEANRRGRSRFNIGYPILLDESGEVGRRYGATNTPHMYVIDKAGVLAYAGALDNTQGGDLEDVDPHIHYVTDALADLAASRPLRVAATEAYGCSVKYAKD